MLTSIRPLILHGIVVDAKLQQLLMPDGSFVLMRTLTVGMAHVYRVGDNRSLPWPPQLVLVEFNRAFLQANEYTGFAKEVSVRARVMRVHLIQAGHDYRRAASIQAWMQARVARILLTQLRLLRITDSHWPPVRDRLTQRVDRFRAHGGNLERLLGDFEDAVARFGRHHTHYGLQKALAACWQAARDGERELDRRLTAAYVFVHATKVINVQSGRLEVERALAPVFNDRTRVKEATFLTQQFQQVQAGKRFFEAHELPLYSAEKLAQAQQLHRRLWEPATDNRYEALGSLGGET